MPAAPYPYLLLLLPAAVLARDDFRTRRVSVAWLAALGIIAAGTSWQQSGLRTMLLQTACNAILTAVLLGGVALWLRVRGWLGSRPKSALSSSRRLRCAPDTEAATRRAPAVARGLRIAQNPSKAIPSASRTRLARQFGAGDAVFLLAVTPLFAPTEFLYFLLAACIAAFIWWSLLRSKRRRTIPLAGFMALTLVGYSLCKFFGLW